MKDSSTASTYRVDIKSTGDRGAVSVSSPGDSVWKPDWFQSPTSEGYCIQGNRLSPTIRLEGKAESELTLCFRGPDIRRNNVRIPCWVCYESILLNGKQILEAPILVWHDKPFVFKSNLKSNHVLTIEIKQKPLDFLAADIKNALIEQCKKHIASHIDDYVAEVIAQNTVRNHVIQDFWKYRTEIALLSGRERVEAERNYYAYCASKASWIGLTAQFASKPVFPHGIHGVFVSGSARIGKGCVIFQGVTIGSNTLSDSKRCGSPNLGDHVYIGAGAKIIGNVTIGNNVRIGANAVVVEDVPDNSIVVMNKPRIIAREGMDNRFYHTKDGKYGYYDDEGEFVIISYEHN